MVEWIHILWKGIPLMKRDRLLPVMVILLAFFLGGCGKTPEEVSVEMVDISSGLPAAGEAALLTESAVFPEAKGEAAAMEETTAVEEATVATPPVAEKGTIRVATIGEPNLEILKQAVVLMREKGYTLEVMVCEDYASPNTMVLEAQADVNLYQHAAFLDRYNQEHGTQLVALDPVYYEPMGIYPGKTKKIEELGAQATIAVPANPTAYAKSLFLLQQAGLIELMEDTDLMAVWEDVLHNPLELTLVEYEEAELPGVLEEADLALFHPGYALAAGMDPEAYLLQEAADGMMAGLLAPVLVAAEEAGLTPAAEELIRVLESTEMKQFIEKNYQGSIIILEG